MAQCGYTRYDNKRCEETAQAGQSLCILHDADPARDAAEFLTALKDKVEREERDSTATQVNLAGVVFPPDFRWADVVRSGKVLGKSASFRSARFSGAAAFKDATFSGDAHFQGATFSGAADFENATFSGVADFENATFSGAAFFWSARFGGAADFENATFSGAAFFGGATFSEAANFWSARFSGAANFGSATFQDWLRFHGTTFPRDEGPGVVTFTNVTLEKPERVYFQDVNLSRASFRGTDIREIHFLNTTWAKLPKRPRPSPPRWPFAPTRAVWRRRARWPKGWALVLMTAVWRRRPVWLWRRPRWWPTWLRPRALNVLYDDPRVSGGGRPQKPAYYQAAELYRQLRVNLEENRQHIEAGDFYVGQMDMRLHDTHIAWRSLLWLYGRAALYGESYGRPLFLYGVTALLFGLFYLAAGFHGSMGVVHRSLLDVGALADPAFRSDWAEATLLALRAGPIPIAEPQPVSRWMLPLRYLNALANVLWLAVAVIALRRAFRR